MCLLNPCQLSFFFFFVRWQTTLRPTSGAGRLAQLSPRQQGRFGLARTDLAIWFLSKIAFSLSKKIVYRSGFLHMMSQG